jgi:hypothetical protein
MTVVLVSTSRRHTSFKEPSGYLYAIDLEHQQVLRRCLVIEPALREVDTNSRGGMRGSKGISVRDDQIALSNFSIVFRYDPRWNLLGIMTHPACAGIHDVSFDGDALWVCSARTDMLLKFDLEGNLSRYYYLRKPSPALQSIGWKPSVLLKPNQIHDGKIDFRDPRTHDSEDYDRAHVNGVCVLSDGTVLASMGLILGTQFSTMLRVKRWLKQRGAWSTVMDVNRGVRSILRLKKRMHSELVVQPAKGRSAVLRISAEGDHALSLALSDITVPSHSLLAMPDDTAIYLNTTEGAVIHFDPHTREILSSTKVTEGFLRGVTRLTEHTILIGSKQELLTFDLEKNQVVSSMRFAEDSNEAVYDIKILPPHYSLPPESFEAHFEREVGFKAVDIVREKKRFPRLEREIMS